MKIVVVFNPVSGTGRSKVAAAALAEQLEAAGHSAVLTPTRRGTDDAWLDAPLRETSAMIVVGGDGAVRLAAGPCSRNRVPIYHVPCGTENLFAREFGMSADPVDVVNAITAIRTRHVDLCEVNGSPFVLMCSVGFDAEVVHHLAARRGKSISHRSYIWPIVRQFLRWSPPRLTIEVDGNQVVKDQRGIVIVANSRQYAWRMDPALPARMDDGLLDVVFMPMHTRIGLLMWSLKCMRHMHMSHPKLTHVRGRVVRVISQQHALHQLDGDPTAAGAGPESETPNAESQSGIDLRITVQAGALPVLLPSAPCAKT